MRWIYDRMRATGKPDVSDAGVEIRNDGLTQCAGVHRKDFRWEAMLRLPGPCRTDRLAD